MSIEDCVSLQTDYLSLPACEIVSILRHLTVSTSSAPAALRLLQEWDGYEDVDSAAAALFETWYRRHLRPRLMRDFLAGSDAADINLDAALRVILPNEDRASDPRTDLKVLSLLDLNVAGDVTKLKEMVDETLPLAVEEVSSLLGHDMAVWAWGELHHSQLFHPFYSLMSTPRPEWATLGPLPRGGSGDTVGAAAYADNFNQTTGSTFRIVIDVGAWDNSVAMNSPGQSADPRSSHYADLFPLWATDQSFPLLYSRKAIEEHATSRINLVPPS